MGSVFDNNYKQLLLNNKIWAKKLITNNTNCAKNKHNPKFLWITCCDSRVSPAYITKSQPGDILEYRSMANIISSNDINFMAILKYAIEFLNIRHIVICGHYDCGGLLTIINKQFIPTINKHLSSAIKVFEDNKESIEILQNINDKANLLSELNVKRQITRLIEIDIIKDSFVKMKNINIYGCLYDINTGIIKDICKVDNQQELLI